MNYLDLLKPFDSRQNQRPEQGDAPRPKPLPPDDTVSMCPAAVSARPVYWEAADGRILGPSIPEFLAQVGAGPTASFWIVTTFEDHPRWINADRLRSRKAFEEQAPVREVESVRTF
jgi:hypothetical protein